ncbi:GNAT family N-acetyltransferase [Shewanella algae]|uniref:GNAT family N-acetyltransferase n=1 Tax=Shewanella algae TaxID=38313 RepID=UPI00292A532D|nr:GNAT family N-acetyltransferase [Shewanella algae]
MQATEFEPKVSQSQQEIVVRHSEHTDIPAIRALFTQPSCYAGTLQQPFPSLEKWYKRLGELPDGYYSLVAEWQGEVAGQLSLQVQTNPRRKHVADLGMAVSEECRGIGVGSTLLAAAVDLAHNWLAVRRLELTVYTDNHAAIALYKRHGFVIEGEARDYAFRDGEYVDVFFMANTRE